MDLSPKYVMINFTEPVMFASSIGHDKATELKPITSAGFFKIIGGEVIVFGESNTLNMKSDPDDAAFIKIHLGLGKG